jgi:hypothetical protein
VSGNAARLEKVYKHIIRSEILSVRHEEVVLDADPGATAKRLSSSQDQMWANRGGRRGAATDVACGLGRREGGG